MATDKIYTPDVVAADVVAVVKKCVPRIVADFAAGDGALLALAAKRWPNAVVVANDVDRSESSKLRRQFPTWRVSTCNFLSAGSVGKSTKLSPLVRRCDLVLLNPPFSYRGWQSWQVDFHGADVKCTQALAFVLRSLEMVTTNGQLVAVLPQGCLSTKADESAWRAIKSSYTVRVVREYGKRTFSGCFPRTVLVQITSRSRTFRPIPIQVPPSSQVQDHLEMVVTIVRGWIPMYTVEHRRGGDSLVLVHSKDLNGSILRNPLNRVHDPRSVSGPGVLMPRVGQPATSNLSILPVQCRVALSDCVIALLTATEREAFALHRTLVDSWSIIEEAFRGTCARYITLERLNVALRECGLINLEFKVPTDLRQLGLRAKTA